MTHKLENIIISIGLLLMTQTSALTAQTAFPPLIPLPQELTVADNDAPFVATLPTQILTDTQAQPAADLFGEWVKSNIALGDTSNKTTGTIVLSVKKTAEDANPEAYTLAVDKDNIRLTAETTSGALMGIQTLRQLMTTTETTITVPACDIKDAPSKQWRGLMLDCARHYMPLDKIFTLLDAMSFMKLNYFHWHLTDCPAWRIESETYPELTDKAAYRGPKSERYGGYYTKQQARDVVAYAAKRGINVVPEFEMPGHSDAAIIAFPELSCKGTPKAIPDENAAPLEWQSLKWFYPTNEIRPLCAGNEKVFEFIGNIFDEYLDVFPCEVWHCGGDERTADIWNNCPKCKARMKELGISEGDEHGLQQWFMKRVSDMLAARGKRPISWAVSRSDSMNPTDMDELGNGAFVINWHDGAAFAARDGRKVINAESNKLYLDYLPWRNYMGPKRADWFPIVDTASIYAFKSVPDGLTQQQQKNIIGVEACLWTEFITDAELFEWLYPRTLALGEAAWRDDQARNDLDGFLKRVDAIEPKVNAMGINYGKPITDAAVKARAEKAKKNPPKY